MGTLLDELREENPTLGFAIYAYKSGEPVTVEVIDEDGVIHTFHGATEQAALDIAFPPLVPTPEPELEETAEAQTPVPPSLFD